jgi:hypothetical protein
MDVMEVSSLKIMEEGSNRDEKLKCTFLTNAGDANRCSLMCARTLLLGINSTILPDSQQTVKATDKEKLQHEAIRILWNGLIKKSAAVDSEEKKLLKPSKLLGRQALIVAYPFIKERFRRGLHEVNKTSNSESGGTNTELLTSQSTSALHLVPKESLTPIPPPKDMDISQWEAYYTEFGNLLTQACKLNNSKQENGYVEDDSALLWSKDKGVHELELRRERRMKRKEEALAEEGKMKGDESA